MSWRLRARELGKEAASWRASCRVLQRAILEVIDSLPPEARQLLEDALEQSRGGWLAGPVQQVDDSASSTAGDPLLAAALVHPVIDQSVAEEPTA